MLKVLCIDASNLPDTSLLDFQLEENKVYEPIAIATHDGLDYYLLHTSRYFKYYYHVKRFVPLSDIDEMDLEKKKESAISNLFQFLK